MLFECVFRMSRRSRDSRDSLNETYRLLCGRHRSTLSRRVQPRMIHGRGRSISRRYSPGPHDRKPSMKSRVTGTNRSGSSDAPKSPLPQKLTCQYKTISQQVHRRFRVNRKTTLHEHKNRWPNLGRLRWQILPFERCLAQPCQYNCNSVISGNISTALRCGLAARKGWSG